MQYTSYHSGHHYSGDQAIAASGTLWPQIDNGVSCRGSRDCNVLFQPAKVDQCLIYFKDFLKETMLKHEAIFKYQIYELHRLYGRQRELMDEMQMKKLSANCFVSQMQCDIYQKGMQQIPYWLMSKPGDDKFQGVEEFQKPSTFVPGKSIHVTSDHYTVESHFKQLESLSTRRNKLRKKLLDLELPAELYMDSENWEQLEEQKISAIHPVLHTSLMGISNPSKESNVVVPSEGTSICSNSKYRRMSVFDLNEPVQEDEQKMSTSSMYSNLCSRETIHQNQDLSGCPRSKPSVSNEILLGVLEKEGNPSLGSTSSHASCAAENLSPDEHDYVARCSLDSDDTKTMVNLNLNATPSIFLPETEACQDKVEFTDGVVNLDLNVTPFSSLSETEVSQEKVESMDGRNGLDQSDYDSKIGLNTTLLEPHSSSSQFSALTSITSPSSSSENEHIQKCEKTEIPGRVVPCNSSPELDNCCYDEAYLGTESVKEICVSEKCIDKSFTLGKDNLSEGPTVPDGVGTGFEAPDSPDRKEWFPPKEESEENQSEQLEDSNKGQSEQLEGLNKGLDRTAAEAIISISLSRGQQCLMTCINCPVDASFNCLNWFAGIASSAADYVEDEFNNILSDAPGGDHQPDIQDQKFKIGSTFCETIRQKNIIPGDTALPSLQQRGQRARNEGGQKEIPAEVAPKDRRVGIRNASKNAKGRRKVGKIGRARGKKLSSKPLPNKAGRRACSVSKQQQHSQESEQSWLFGWGKKSRRQKHKRAQ